MTTNTTNSQAASIDTPEFRQRLSALVDAKHGSFYKAIDELVAHIDAKLAQAFNDGAIEGRIHQRGIDAAESRLAAVRCIDGVIVINKAPKMFPQHLNTAGVDG